jgi:amino acid permease
MITLNGTLGAGLYWRGGHALQVGGVLSLILSFMLVGFLAWAVMQCIAEMLCLWPIPGAISVYVRTFVDDELGIAVGVAYWHVLNKSQYVFELISPGLKVYIFRLICGPAGYCGHTDFILDQRK